MSLYGKKIVGKYIKEKCEPHAQIAFRLFKYMVVFNYNKRLNFKTLQKRVTDQNDIKFKRIIKREGGKTYGRRKIAQNFNNRWNRKHDNLIGFDCK